MKRVIDKVTTAIANHIIDLVIDNKELLENNIDELKKHIKRTIKRNQKLTDKITKIILEGAKNG